MASAQSVKPEEFFSRETGDLPFSLDLSEPGWSLVSLPGATQRGWLGPAKIDATKVQQWVASAISESETAYVKDVVKKVVDEHGEVPEKAISEAVEKLVQDDKLMSYKGQPTQQDKPSNLLHGTSAILHSTSPDDVLITPSAASKRGWVTVQKNTFRLEGRQGTEKLLELLPRLGSFYARGASSKIQALEMIDLEIHGGGRLRLTLENVSPEGMKRLGELLEVLDTAVDKGPATEVFLEIDDPSEDCLFFKALKEGK